MNKKDEAAYAAARKKCRLTDTEVRMAAALGIPPEALPAMIPSRKESWKDPVPLRIRRLYEKTFGDTLPK